MGLSLAKETGALWRIVGAAVAGTAHTAGAISCQDAFAWSEAGDQSSALIIAASDGAGSAQHSDVGSRVACGAIIGEISDTLRSFLLEQITRASCEHWILGTHAALSDEARCLGVELRELACTLVVAIVDASSALFLQIGDGGSVFVSDVSPLAQVALWPESGDFPNETFFVTDSEALTHLHTRYVGERLIDVSVFSDGLQRLALRYDLREPHYPFFEQPFRSLAAEPPGFSGRLADDLVLGLSSEAVNARTDDDKTLVLATRRDPTVDAVQP